MLQGSFPTFVFVKKVGASAVVFIRVFHGVLGGFASLIARVFYCIWLVFSMLARFFCFFAGGFGKGLQAVDAFRGFGVVFVAEACSGEAVGSQVVFVFAHQGEFLPEVFELAGAGAVEEGAVL